MYSVQLIILVSFYYFCSIECFEGVSRNKSSEDSWNELLQTSENIHEQGRTFGLRRLKIAIPLIMFKLGVLTTLMGFLTLIAIKTLTIGIILLVGNVSAFLAKLKLLKHDHGWGGGHTGYGAQDVHVHLHHDQHSSIPVYHHGYHHDHHHGGHHGDWDKSGAVESQELHINRLNFLKNLYQNYRNSLYQQDI